MNHSESNNTINDKNYKTINFNLLKTQINKYHMNNHSLAIDQLNNCNDSKIQINNHNRNYIFKPEFEICRKSPSILTSLSAPRASIDCYQSSTESFSLHNERTNRSPIRPQSSTNFLSQNVSINSAAVSSNLLDTNYFDKIIDDCALCKEFAFDALNNSTLFRQNNNNQRLEMSDFQLFEEVTSVNTELNRNLSPKLVTTTGQKPDYILKCIFFCCYQSLATSFVYKFFKEKRIRLKKLVDQELQRAILCAILINTLSMGIEHHDQVLLILIFFFLIINNEKFLFF